MKIILTSVNKNLCNEWETLLSDFNYNIDILYNIGIDEINADALVSPANSFCIMDGGIDYIIREMFGHDIEEELIGQAKIKFGRHFVPIGQSVSVNLQKKESNYFMLSGERYKYNYKYQQDKW